VGTTQKKYSDYIYQYDARDGFSFSPNVPFEIVTRIHSKIVEGSNFYFVHWVLPHNEPFLRFGHPPHIHKNPELLFHIGSDPDNPQDLGAEVEMYMGPEMEKHVITESCVVFIPANFVHCPHRFIRSRRPWIFIMADQGPVHTEKGYHQILPRDLVEQEWEHLSRFVDEGF
jgi:hypothetical protein